MLGGDGARRKGPPAVRPGARGSGRKAGLARLAQNILVERHRAPLERHGSGAVLAGSTTMRQGEGGVQSIEETAGGRRRIVLEDPPLARALFQSTGASPLWLVVRIWVGWQWLDSGWAELRDPFGIGGVADAIAQRWSATSQSGLSGGWQSALADWLLAHQAQGTLASALALAETVIGLAIFLGAFVGLLVAAGVLLDLLTLLLAGIPPHPTLLGLAVLLVLAWKNAGYIGFDRYLLRWFGAPWWSASAATGPPPAHGARPGRG